MILAIDQGTTGTTCLVFDGEGRVRGRAYSEFAQHFPRPGWVEHDPNEIWDVTRRVASHALADAKADPGQPRRDRDHQPARDRRRLEPRNGRAGPQRARLAGPPHRGSLRRAARGRATSRWSASAPASSSTRTSRGRRSSGCCATSTPPQTPSSARSTPGWCSSSPGATPPTSPTPRGRCCSTSANDAGTRSCASCSASTRRRCRRRCRRPASSGPRTSSAARSRSPGSPATSRRRCSARPASGRAWRRTPTGRAASSSSTPATEMPEPAEGLLTTVAWGIGDEVTYALEAAVFVTGAAVQWLRDGLGIVAEAAETEGMAASLRVQRRRLLRPRPHRPRLAPLGSLRARDDRRAHPRHHPRPPGAGGARGDRVPDGRRGPRPGAGRRRAAARAARRRRRGRQPVADAVPGRRPRRPGDRARDRRDDGARRRLPRRDRRPAAGAPTRSPGCGARRRATSRGWRRASASACSAAGPRRSSGRAAGRAEAAE